jgi:hypothetical protein
MLFKYLRRKNFCVFNKNLTSFNSKNNNLPHDPKVAIRKIKSYLELLSSKEIEKELGLIDLKKFFGLTKISKDYLNSNVVETIEIKIKIKDVISLNKSLENNLELTKYVYNDLQYEKNDFIFKLLIANAFSLIKKNDEDSSLLEYLPFISWNLKPIDGKTILKSDILLTNIQKITQEFNTMDNYKAADTSEIINFLNIFPDMGVDITNEDFYKFHFNKIIKEKLNLLESGKLKYTEAFDYFKFIITFKDTSLDLKMRFEIKERFKNYFEKLMLDVIKLNEIEPSAKIFIRFDDLLFIMKSTSGSINFIKICEYILNLKLNEHICPIETMLDMIKFYIDNNLINKSILHFISYNTMEHLKLNVMVQTFENSIVTLYGFICEYNHHIPNSETVNEFLEEFKSCLFNNKFLDMLNIEFYSVNIKFETLETIRIYHKRLLGGQYYDEAFDNFLKKAIDLNKNLACIF